jgi:hypothetical protein
MQVQILEFDDETCGVGDSSLFISGPEPPASVNDTCTTWYQDGTYLGRRCKAYWCFFDEEGLALADTDRESIVMPGDRMHMVSFCEAPPRVLRVYLIEGRSNELGRRGNIELLEAGVITSDEKFCSSDHTSKAPAKYAGQVCTALGYISKEAVTDAGYDLGKLPFKSGHGSVVFPENQAVMSSITMHKLTYMVKHYEDELMDHIPGIQQHFVVRSLNAIEKYLDDDKLDLAELTLQTLFEFIWTVWLVNQPGIIVQIVWPWRPRQ